MPPETVVATVVEVRRGSRSYVARSLGRVLSSLLDVLRAHARALLPLPSR